MTDNEIMYNLLEGLKQLDMNLKLLESTHKMQGLDTNSAYTVNTANLLKSEYADKSLEMLQEQS